MHPNALEARQLDTRRSTAGPIFILADDLTGACDSAVAFVAAGRRVRVVLDLAKIDPASVTPDSVHSFSTETRSLTEKEATEQVARSIARVRDMATDPTLFKKVDSAARGHFGAETLAALHASGAALALVAPAFPVAGRTVLNGILTIRDAADQSTKIALRDLFPDVDPAHIVILPAASACELEEGIARAVATGIRFLLCDAQTQAELEHLAIAASRLDQPILWAGSAGLAQALAGKVLPSHTAPHVRPETGEGCTLVFIGTDHPVTALQRAHLDAHPPVHLHAVHSIDWRRVSPQQVREAFTGAPTAALVLTGGETAAYVLRALHASSIQLAGEVVPGIPWGIVEGGNAGGCIVVTKSGGFGSQSALADAIDFCAQRCGRRAHASA